MQKVIIVGCPGGGKSTFARALHNELGIPLYHLDLLYWKADRTVVPKSVFIEKLQNIIKEDRWIIDGNYGSTMEMRMKACDTVFFLDYPMDVCFAGIASRRGKRRADMPWIEKSDEDAEFISFIKNFNTDSRPDVIELLKKYQEKNIVVFHSREEAGKFLENLSGKE